MEELEVLLRKLEMADMDGLQALLEAGLREAAGVYADVLESALEEARERRKSPSLLRKVS